MGSEPDRFTKKRVRIAWHCPPSGLITVDVGWAVNQTDLLSRAIAKRFLRNIALLGTAHQTNH
ncbi:MAG: hypothetical protein F6K26_36345 [Moorea sp. SIO2I5]|nr:hypothetical protein [Moorena sp. SIO2I5]